MEWKTASGTVQAITLHRSACVSCEEEPYKATDKPSVIPPGDSKMGEQNRLSRADQKLLTQAKDGISVECICGKVCENHQGNKQ